MKKYIIPGIQAQTASPTFTHVYAALAAIINTKFPNIGELLLKRFVTEEQGQTVHRNKVIDEQGKEQTNIRRHHA